MSHYYNHCYDGLSDEQWRLKVLQDRASRYEAERTLPIEEDDDRPDVLFVEAPARILATGAEDGFTEAVEIVVYGKDGNIVGAMTRKAAETFFGDHCVGGRFKVRAMDVDEDCIKRLVGLERIDGCQEKPKEESAAERLIRNRSKCAFWRVPDVSRREKSLYL